MFCGVCGENVEIHATSRCRSSIQLNDDSSVVNFVPKTSQEVTEIETSTEVKSLPLFEFETEKKTLIAV